MQLNQRSKTNRKLIPSQGNELALGAHSLAALATAAPVTPHHTLTGLHAACGAHALSRRRHQRAVRRGREPPSWGGGQDPSEGVGEEGHLRFQAAAHSSSNSSIVSSLND